MKSFASSILLLCLFAATAAPAVTVTLAPSQDNTLYETEDGSLSNGQGDYLFAGKTNSESLRRGVLAFDVASAAPAGATVTGVTLTLHLSKSISTQKQVSLHRLSAGWGEGTSNANGQEGGGIDATLGDATWIHRSWNQTTWSQAGGDFTAPASASQMVGLVGDPSEFYVWGSTPAMVADVQGWLDNPATNFGWILIGDETEAGTAKRFDARESGAAELRPKLTIEYATGGGPDADFNADGSVDGADLLAWQQGLGVVAGASRAQGDADGDGAVNAADLAAWTGQFGGAVPAIGAVPEPAGLGALALLTLVAARRRRGSGQFQSTT